MAKNKSTPKQQMKSWIIEGIEFKARTHRVAMRKYLKGNYAHDMLIRDLELDNPFGGNETPSEAVKIWKKLYDEYRAKARSKMSSAR